MKAIPRWLPTAVILFLIVSGFAIKVQSRSNPLVFQTDSYLILVKGNESRIIFYNGTVMSEIIPEVFVTDGLFKDHNLYLAGKFRNHPALILLNPLKQGSARIYYIPDEEGAIFSLSKNGSRLVGVGYVKEGATYNGLEFFVNLETNLIYGLRYTALINNYTLPTYFRDIDQRGKITLIVGDAFWRSNYYPTVALQDSETLRIRESRVYVGMAMASSLRNNYIVKGLLTHVGEEVQLLIMKGDALYLSKLLGKDLELEKVIEGVKDAYILREGAESWVVLADLENNSRALVTNEFICPIGFEGNYLFIKNNTLLSLGYSGEVSKVSLGKCSSWMLSGPEVSLQPIRIYYVPSNITASSFQLNLVVKFREETNTVTSAFPTNGTLTSGITITEGVNRLSKPLGEVTEECIDLFIAGLLLLVSSYFIKRKIS